MASTIGELLVWVPTPAARASTAVPIHRSSISSGSNTNFHRASVSSLADLLSAADEEDIDDLELISGAKEHKLIARMEKAQRRLRASKSQMELNKRKQQHDELAMLWRLEGELQAAAGGPLGAPERRVRKDFGAGLGIHEGDIIEFHRTTGYRVNYQDEAGEDEPEDYGILEIREILIPIPSEPRDEP